jgi:hypothetical protein
MPIERSTPVGNGADQAAAAEDGEQAELDALPIHLVDLGKVGPKAIKQLKKGGGKLHQAVVDALGEIEYALGEETAGKTVLPVVVVVEKKRKRRSALPLSLL